MIIEFIQSYYRSPNNAAQRGVIGSKKETNTKVVVLRVLIRYINVIIAIIHKNNAKNIPTKTIDPSDPNPK
jgi:hypothetical protein